MPNEPATPLLTDTQRRITGFSLTLLAFLASTALLIAVCIVLGRLIGFFSNVLWPLAVAGVLALMLRPVVEIVQRHMRLRRLPAVILLYTLFVILVAGALVLILPPLVEQIIGFVSDAPTYWAKARFFLEQQYPQWMDFAQRHLANPNVRRMVESLTAEAQGLLSHALPSLRVAFGGVFDVLALFTHLAIIPVYLFFFLLARGEPTRNLGENLTFLRSSVRSDVVFLASEFVSIVEAFFRGQLLIGLCMGVLFSVGFALIGLKFALLLGLTLGLLNIVPYLGSILGLAITLPLAFFQPGGGWQLLGLVILVLVIVQCIEGWVLTPKIMGHHTGLHPVMIIVAIFFWGTAFGGVLGMVLAVPLTAFFVTAWRLAKRKYFLAPNV